MSAGRDETFKDTVRRVKLSDLRRKPIEIEFDDGRKATIPKVSVKDVMTLFSIEQERVDSIQGGDVAAAQTVLTRMHDSVLDIVEKYNPGFFEFGRPELDMDETNALMGMLLGRDSAAEAVDEALHGTPEEVEARAAEREQERQAAVERGEEPDDDGEQGADASPPDSTKPSPPPSSTSGESSAGDPNGGTTTGSPGTPSEPISGISAEAA